MTILGICDSLEVLKVLQIVRTVITIIKIVVPILLLLACTISFVKAVKNDDELDKVKKGIVSKVIAAILKARTRYSNLSVSDCEKANNK